MELSPEQQAAVDSNAPLIVVEAASGSGKTRVLIHRILRLIRDGVPPEAIVAITYTQKAAQEMQERLGSVRLGYTGTLHSYCLRIVRENHKVLNLPPQLSVVDDTLKEQVLQEAVSEQKYKGTQVAVELVLKAGYYAPPVLVKKKEHNVARSYWTKMREGGMLDFDSILHYAIEALVHRKAVTSCQHLLVDEIQDASHLDYQVYRALDCAKFFVGDGRQAIFGFRDGDVRWMRELAASAVFCGGLLHLTGNYRCGSSIVYASNSLISHDDAQHVPAVSLTDTTGIVTVAQFKSDREELDAIAGVLLKNCSTNEEFSDCAVLCRYNQHVTRFCDGLRARGVPVAAKQQNTVPKDWGLALALVSFIGNPFNDRLALIYREAFSGKEAALKEKTQASRMLCSVFDCFVDKSIAHLTRLPDLLGRCLISKESCDILLPLLEHCTTPNELLLSAHEAVQQDTVQGQGVRVMTLHACKGLEFSMIILPAFEETILPGSNEENLCEDRRLAYVGFTRAKERLVITWCKERQKLFGFGSQSMEPSRFIKEANL